MARTGGTWAGRLSGTDMQCRCCGGSSWESGRRGFVGQLPDGRIVADAPRGWEPGSSWTCFYCGTALEPSSTRAAALDSEVAETRTELAGIGAALRRKSTESGWGVRLDYIAATEAQSLVTRGRPLTADELKDALEAYTGDPEPTSG